MPTRKIWRGALYASRALLLVIQFIIGVLTLILRLPGILPRISREAELGLGRVIHRIETEIGRF